MYEKNILVAINTLKKAKERADEGNGDILIPFMQTDDVFVNTKVFSKDVADTAIEALKMVLDNGRVKKKGCKV